MTAHTDPEDHTVTTPEQPEFNTGTGCQVNGSGGWCVAYVDCESHCDPNGWRDEFVEYRDNALRDPEVRAAYDSADAGGRERQAEETP